MAFMLHGGECGEAVLQVGWFSAIEGKSRHVNIEGLIGDTFKVKKSTDQNVLVGAGYYLDQGDFLYGINAFYLAPTKVKGVVVQEDLFTNLSFRYSLMHFPIYFAVKGLIHFCQDSDLVLEAGIGPNIVCTKGFRERSLDGGITIPDSHLFSGKAQACFSVTAGLGWRFSDFFELNYRFFYLGEGELKKNNSQLKNSLRTGHIYANALFLSIIL